MRRNSRDFSKHIRTQRVCKAVKYSNRLWNIHDGIDINLRFLSISYILLAMYRSLIAILSVLPFLLYTTDNKWFNSSWANSLASIWDSSSASSLNSIFFVRVYVDFYEKLPLPVVRKSQKVKVQAHLWQLVFLIL